jgi:ribose/xylose/arabinose/galactoside ABC-type transport system permease subunit
MANNNVERPQQISGNTKVLARRFLRHENAVLIVVLVALIAGLSAITRGAAATRVNVMNVLLQSSIRGVASIGQAFVILSAGIDLSVGGVGLFCSVLGTTLLTSNMALNLVGHPVSLFVAIPLMVLAGAGIGAVNGLLVARVGLPPLIVTLGMWQIIKGAAFQLCSGSMVYDLPESLAFFGSGSIAGVPVPSIVFIAVAVIAYFVLQHTIFGHSVYAIGGNNISAWLSGIKVGKGQIIVTRFPDFSPD